MEVKVGQLLKGWEDLARLLALGCIDDLPLLIQVLHTLLLGALFHIDSASFRLHPGSFAVKISDRP